MQEAVAYAASRSFNCISIDGDTSTNDSFVLIATGKAQMPEIADARSAEYHAFRDAVTDIATRLAQAIVRDVLRCVRRCATDAAAVEPSLQGVVIPVAGAGSIRWGSR